MDTLPLNNNDVAEKKRAMSSFVKGGIGLMVTANVDMLVAFSTAYWATWKSETTGEYGGYGLWKMWHCGGATDDGGSLQQTPQCVERMADLNFPGWYVTTQVFQTLGLAGFLTAVIMLLLYAFLPQWERSKSAMSALVAISYLSGLSVVVGLCVFGFKVAEEVRVLGVTEWFLSWSFSLAITAFVMNQIAASILVTETKRLYKEHEEERSKPAARRLSVELREMIIKPDVVT